MPNLLYALSSGDSGRALIVTICLLPVEIIYTYGLLQVVPEFLRGRNYLRVLLKVVALNVLSIVLTSLVNSFLLAPILFGIWVERFEWNLLYRFSWYQFITTNAIAMTAVLIRMFKHWYNELQAKMQAEQMRIETEMQLLKAQINPHFLFNTLNNLYTLVYEKSDKAPDMLLQLSDLLSYFLYECKMEKVLLEDEIGHMKDYVLLERERYGDRLDISFSVAGDCSGRYVTPLLFLPFIENAFKHGTSELVGRVCVSIAFLVSDDRLKFSIVNSCDGEGRQRLGSGIGIGNVKKRLELLYPGKYHLSYGRQNNVYRVSLDIEMERDAAYGSPGNSEERLNMMHYEGSLHAGR